MAGPHEPSVGRSSAKHESLDTQSIPQRRHAIARLVHSLWTTGGADESGLAPALFDGRVDALGTYVVCSSEERKTLPLDQHVPCNIQRIHCKTLSYNNFLTNYMLPNQPVIIDGLAENWRASREWVDHDEIGIARPNVHRLAELFGEDVVPVHVQLKAGFTIARPKKEDMTMSEYLRWWETHSISRDDDDDDDVLLYLKDWKFVAIHGEDYDAYAWPEYFLDDWLNGAMGHAYKFIYLGPAGTSTRLHADVLRSFSWSTNVCGRKRWYLIPPEYTHLLYDCFGTRLASHLNADVQEGLQVFFPGLAEARQHAIEVVQEAGETMFVPSGWHHTVENLEPTLSINHNWLNGANVHWSWKKLKSELDSSHTFSLEAKVTEPNNNIRDHRDESAQVGDDLLLLWFVLSKKANAIMANAAENNKSLAAFDLSAIHPILVEMQELIQDGADHGLTTRCQCNIDELITRIKVYLH